MTRLPEDSIRPTRPRADQDQFLVTREALAIIALALRRRDPEECTAPWQEILRRIIVGR